MSTVKQRARKFKQPRGGFAPLKLFENIKFSDSLELSEENIHNSIVGSSVDYLSRIQFGTVKRTAFDVSFIGAHNLGMVDVAETLISKINGIDDESIIAACKLVGFDSAYRFGLDAYKPIEDINPNKETIKNIQIMTERVKSFIDNYGPIIQDGFRFDGAYTCIIADGDGDFLTHDTVWDLKVIKARPDSKMILQLLIYYLMGKTSKNPNFDEIKKMGIFNPRLNQVYILDIDKLPEDILNTVSCEVIGYK